MYKRERAPCPYDVYLTNIVNRPRMYWDFKSLLLSRTPYWFGAYARVKLIKSDQSTTIAFLRLQDTSFHEDLIQFFENEYWQRDSEVNGFFWMDRKVQFQLNLHPRDEAAVYENTSHQEVEPSDNYPVASPSPPWPRCLFQPPSLPSTVTVTSSSAQTDPVVIAPPSVSVASVASQSDFPASLPSAVTVTSSSAQTEPVVIWSCPKRVVKSRYCKRDTPEKRKHQELCAARTDQCPECNRSILLRYMEHHRLYCDRVPPPFTTGRPV